MPDNLKFYVFRLKLDQLQESSQKESVLLMTHVAGRYIRKVMLRYETNSLFFP
jgi:hypothetical protein